MNGKAYSHIVGCLLGLQSQISAKSQQSVLKLIEEILDPLPQPSTTNRQPPRGPACDRLLVHLWQVQRGSRQPRPEAKLQNLENATQQRCSRCAEKLLQKYCSFFHHILYCWSNRNKCVRQLGESFISFNFNITSMTTNATKCQPLPLGLTLPTMLERHLSGWCPCKWRRLHRPGLQSKSTPSFGCLMKSCYGYPSRISSNIDNINCNCRYNYRMIKLKHSFVQLQASLSGLHVPSHVLLENKWFPVIQHHCKKQNGISPFDSLGGLAQTAFGGF